MIERLLRDVKEAAWASGCDCELLRYGDASGVGWADVIDTLTMYPDARRKVVRLLAEIDAAG